MYASLPVKFARGAVIFFGTILILFSLLSLIYDIPKWYLKVLDFPRLQQLLLSLLFLLLFVFLNRKWQTPSIAFTVGLVAAAGIHFVILSPYLIGSKLVPDATLTDADKPSTVKIMIANVLVTNRKADGLNQIIRKNNPDMILVMEVNDWWTAQLAYLTRAYPYTMEYPLDNAYGMSLYSRFPLLNSEIRFLNHEKVPSFHAVVQLPGGKKFKFHGVHPVAPFPSSKYPENIGQKGGSEEAEVELLKVGKLVARNKLPTIVAGDFNDVSWSNTSRLFGENGNLNDVRIGRGLNNTFDARSWLMKWPLDHFYVTKNIAVLSFKPLPAIHSDHYPLFGEFVIR